MSRTGFVLGLAALAAIAVPAAFAPPAFAQAPPGSEVAKEIAIGKTVVPVPLTIPAGVDANSVYFGSYIVNTVAGCNDCHSNNEFAPGGNPFAGQPKQVNVACYMNGGQAFGPFVSRNVTPNAAGKPAGLTYLQFRNVLLTGNDPQDPGTLLEVMPWPSYQNMTNTQMKAIYDYLSSIPRLKKSC